MYQNEIRGMDETELAGIVRDYKLKIEDTGVLDADEVIELLSQEYGRGFECAEDDILDSIMNGNWTDAITCM